MTNTANLKRFSDRTEQILSTIKSGNRMSLDTSGSLKEHLEAITGKYSSVLTAAPENPSQGDKWFDGKSTWTYNGTAWLPEFVTPNKSYFSFAATATANTATDLTQEIEMADNDLYKVTLDLAVTDCGLSTVFVVKEDGGNGVKLWNGSSWATSGTIDVHTLSGNLNSEPVLTFVPVAKGPGETHNKFKIQITSATSLSCRGTATIDHLLSGAITDGAVYDPTSGGGGSGDGFQPDRVIVIDTTLAQDVTGKAYATFAAAYAYAESQQPVGGELRFCIQFPAGNFNQAVTLNDWLTVRGNNTVLTGTLTSLAVFDMMSGQHEPAEYICGDKRHLVGCTVKSSIVNGPGFTYTVMENCDFAPVSFTDDSSSPQTLTYMHTIVMIGCRTYPGTYNMGRTIICAHSSVLSGSFTTTALHGTGDPSTDAALAGAARWSLSSCFMIDFSLSNVYASNMLEAMNSMFVLLGSNATSTVIEGDYPEFILCDIDSIHFTGSGAVFDSCNVVGTSDVGKYNTFTVVPGVIPSRDHHINFYNCWVHAVFGIVSTIPNATAGSGLLRVRVKNSVVNNLRQPEHSYPNQYVDYNVRDSEFTIEKVSRGGDVPSVPSVFGPNETFTFEYHTTVKFYGATFAGSVTVYPTCLVYSEQGFNHITAGVYDPNEWREY